MHRDEQTPKSLVRRYPFDAGFFLGTGLSGILFLFILHGGFPLAARVGDRRHYYTVEAISFLHGHLAVPTSTLGNECFLIKGKCIGYYGIGPSIIRLPVALLGNGAIHDSVEASYFILGFLVAALGAWWIARQLVAICGPGLTASRLQGLGLMTAVAGLGASPLLFLACRPLVYEDAILWGIAFAAVSLGAVISMALRPRGRTLVVLLLADLMAVSSRPTVGSSAIFATVVVGVWQLHRARAGLVPAPQRRGAMVSGLWLVLGALVALLSAPFVLYLKFGTISVPYRYHVNTSRDPAALKDLQHSLNLGTLPTKIVSVFRPDSLTILRNPPHVALGEHLPIVIPPAKLTDVSGLWEPTSSLTDTMPFSTMASAIGIVGAVFGLKRWWARRREEDLRLVITALVLVSAIGAVFFGLLFPGQTYRYIADWLPLLFLAAPAGLAVVAAHLPSGWAPRLLLVGLGCALLGVQLLIQTGLAVSGGMTTIGEQPAACPGPPNPYGPLGVIFCPAAPRH